MNTKMIDSKTQPDLFDGGEPLEGSGFEDEDEATEALTEDEELLISGALPDEVRHLSNQKRHIH